MFVESKSVYQGWYLCFQEIVFSEFCEAIPSRMDSIKKCQILLDGSTPSNFHNLHFLSWLELDLGRGFWAGTNISQVWAVKYLHWCNYGNNTMMSKFATISMRALCLPSLSPWKPHWHHFHHHPCPRNPCPLVYHGAHLWTVRWQGVGGRGQLPPRLARQRRRGGQGGRWACEKRKCTRSSTTTTTTSFCSPWWSPWGEGGPKACLLAHSAT